MRRTVPRSLFLILFSVFFLLSCGGNAEDRTPAVKDATVSEEDHTVTLENASVQGMIRLDRIDRLMGVYDREGNYCAVGEKDGHPVVVTLKADGEILSVEDLETVKAGEEEDDAPALYAAANASDGTLALLFGRVTGDRSAAYYIGLYDSSLRLKEERFLCEKDGMLYGMCALPDGVVCVLWPEVIYVSAGSAEPLEVRADNDLYFHGITPYENSRCLVFGSSANGVEVVELLPEDGTLQGSVRAGNVSTSGTCAQRTEDGRFFFCSNERLYEYIPREERFRERFSFSVLPFQGNMVRQIASTAQDHFALATRQSNDLYLVSAKEETTQRQTVVMAAVRSESGGDFMLEQFIDWYNLQSDRYLLQAEYYEYDNADQLLPKLVTADAPDLVNLCAFNIVPNETGFQDLMPYLDADDGAIRSMLHPGMLAALQTEGKLLQIPSGLWLNTVFGDRADVGDSPGWTFDDFFRLTSETGAGRKPFSDFYSGEAVMARFCCFAQGLFIDNDAHESRFSNETFYRMLRFCKEELSPVSDKTADPTDSSALLFYYTIQRTLLFENPFRYGDAPFTYIGFPSDGTSNGSWYEPDPAGSVYAIPVLSGNPEGAADVIRRMLSEDWQRQIWALPLNRNVLEEQLLELTTKEDAAVTQENLQQIWQLIDGVTVFNDGDDTIEAIITEECSAYFAGAKSEEETAQTIDSRINQYLRERQ